MIYKIPIKINNWQYNIRIKEKEFASYLEKEIMKDINCTVPLHSKKLLLHAYIKAQYKIFMINKKIEYINKKLKDNY